MNSGVEKIKDIIKPIVDSFDLVLDDIVYITHGRRWVLRVYIDKEEGGVTLEDCEKVSVQLSQILDSKDIIPHAYILEVSSPGLDRPLKRIKDYKKYTGRLIKLNILKPYNDKTSLAGRIISVTDEKIEIEAEKTGRVEILFSDISNARLEIEF